MSGRQLVQRSRQDESPELEMLKRAPLSTSISVLNTPEQTAVACLFLHNS